MRSTMRPFSGSRRFYEALPDDVRAVVIYEGGEFRLTTVSD